MWFKTYRENNDRLDPYVIDFDCQEDIDEEIFENPLKQAIEAVNNIVRDYPSPYNVFVSGGIDSQAMLWAWVKSGHRFRTCHFDYGNDLNYHDRKYLDKFITKNNLEETLDLKIIPFDAVKFITSSELADYAKKYDTVSPQILTHIKLCEQVEGTAVFGGNYIIPLDPQSTILNYTILGLQRCADLSPKKIVPFFFLENPRLSYSFFKFLHESKDGGYLGRIKAYQKNGFPVTPQPNKKTGFENIKRLFDHVKIPAKDRLRWIERTSLRPFDFLYRYSNFEHTGLYSDQIKIKHHRWINNYIKNAGKIL